VRAAGALLLVTIAAAVGVAIAVSQLRPLPEVSATVSRQSATATARAALPATAASWSVVSAELRSHGTIRDCPLPPLGVIAGLCRDHPVWIVQFNAAPPASCAASVEVDAVSNRSLSMSTVCG
jgi:hypothetical protein